MNRKILLIFALLFSSPQAHSSLSQEFQGEGYMILGGPAVSKMILETLQTNKTHVLNLSTDPEVSSHDLNLLDQEAFFAHLKENAPNDSPLMINSEFAQQIVGEKGDFSSSYEFASYFRNKAKFREWLKDVFPDFFFKSGSLDDFSDIRSSDEIPYPVIIKPATGYLSLCVHKANSHEELQGKLALIRQSYEQIKRDYPRSMVNCDNLIMEKFISGPEVAVEGYYSLEGKPVVFNIMARTFKDADDTSDIIYYTSKKVMETYLQQVTDLLEKMGEKTPFKNFPFIAELRVDQDTGKLTPIELNPLRSSGNFIDELSKYAYGINNYDYFFNQKAPDWNGILSKQDDSVYGTFGAFIPEGLTPEGIESVDEERLKGEFSQVLEYRDMLGKSQCVYGILFYKAPDITENERLIHLDLGEYIKSKT